MGYITSNVALASALSFSLGVVFCSCCTFFVHLALSPLPADGKWYISTFVIAVRVGVAGTIMMYLYLRRTQEIEEAETGILQKHDGYFNMKCC